MNAPSLGRTELAHAALQVLPSRIRVSLIAEPDFRAEYGLTTDAQISFGARAAFKRSALFDCAREVLDRNLPRDIVDSFGKHWRMSSAGDGTLALVAGVEHISADNFFALSSDKDARLRHFALAALAVNLPAHDQAPWHAILSERALTDDEAAALIGDLADTPVRCASRLLGEMRIGSVDLRTLVPKSPRYYERLVGKGNPPSVASYAHDEMRRQAADLIKWRAKEGFLWSLMLGSHSSNVAEIPVALLPELTLVQAYELISSIGDRVSQAAALEIGLKLVNENPAIEPHLVTIARKFRDDNAEDKTSQFALLSALFVLVDSELARMRIAEDRQPYWRRMAALAQASLIERCAVTSEIEWDGIIDWALSRGGMRFYVQTLCDLRVEPRWLPDFAAPGILKTELVGRVLAVANSSQSTWSTELNSSITGSDSLAASVPFHQIFLPGPLEGATLPLQRMPEDLATEIEARLKAAELEPRSFAVLVNAALMFEIEVSHADLAAQGLRAANNRLKNANDPTELLAILRGLAHVAAASRSLALADELAILTRRCRAEGLITLVDSFPVYLVGAASRSTLDAWSEFVGKWLTELALSCEEHDDARTLHANLTLLLRSAPSLWIVLGRANAALRAVLRI